MSTYTPSLGLEEITPGDQAGLWGNTTNNNLTLIDQAVTGVTPIDFTGLSGTVYTLTDYNGAVDESRSAVLNITGAAGGSNTVIIPNKQKTYLVRNNTGQDVTFRTAAPSASYTVGASYSILIFCDGNNGVFTGIAAPSVGTLTVSAGGTGATTFTAGFLVSPGGTTAFTTQSTIGIGGTSPNQTSGQLPASSGGTGQSTLTSGAVLVGNGTGAVQLVTPSTSGYVLTSNGPSSNPTFQAPASAGVTALSAGTGISLSGSTGSITVTNSGVTSLSAGSGISISGSTGGITISASGGSGVTSFNGRTGAVSPSSTDYSSFYPLLSSSPNFTGGAVWTGTVGYGIGCSSTTDSFIIGGSPYISVNNINQFFPNADNTLNCGTGGNRWAQVYAAVGTINTSDANEKQQVADLTSAEKAVGQAIKGIMKSFKFNDSVKEKGTGARIHFGVVAQDVKAIFESHGLDANKYGLFCSDTWYEVNGNTYDEEGHMYSKDSVGAVERTRLGIRYEELFALIIGAL